MTDRYNYLIVALERNIRSDDCQPLIDAIKMLHGVLDVTPRTEDPSGYTTEMRVREEMRKKVWEIFYPKEET